MFDGAEGTNASSSVFNDIRLDIKIDLNIECQPPADRNRYRNETCPARPPAFESTQSEPSTSAQTFDPQPLDTGESLLSAQLRLPSSKAQSANVSDNTNASESFPRCAVAATGQTPRPAAHFSRHGYICLPLTRRPVRRHTTGSVPLTNNITHVECSFKPSTCIEGDESAQRENETPRLSPDKLHALKNKLNDVSMVNAIDHAHINYGLMNNMLEGIRISLSRCQAKVLLTDQDYTATQKFSKTDVEHKDYAPQVFCELREDCFNLDRSQYQLFLAENQTFYESEAAESGSFCYSSYDHRFVIKTIHQLEHKCLLRILKQYHEHIKNTPETLLPRFCGLHRVKLPGGRKIHFMVTENIFSPQTKIHEIYNLKRSTLGREFLEESAKENLHAMLKNMNMNNRSNVAGLGSVERERLTEQLRKDMEFLLDVHIMNYSLVVGIHYCFSTSTHHPAEESVHGPPKHSCGEAGVLGMTDHEANPAIYYLGIANILTSYSGQKGLKYFWPCLKVPSSLDQCTAYVHRIFTWPYLFRNPRQSSSSLVFYFLLGLGIVYGTGYYLSREMYRACG